MMKKFLLLACSLVACVGVVRAGDVSRYAEFARAYGIVRYFSPNPYTQRWSESDWMKVCALLASRAGSQPLEQVFRPLAPTLFFSDVPAPAPEDAASEAVLADTLASDAASAAHAADAPASYYLYSGSGELHIPFIARLFIPGLADYIPYYKRLVRVGRDSVAAPVARRYYAYRLFGGRVLHIQHALPREAFDAAATRRLLSEARRSWDSHRSAESGLSRRRSFVFGLLSDPAVRVADVTVRWNIIRHFYPYYEEDSLDWERRLEPFLQEALSMERVERFETILEWRELLCRLFHPVKDGHLFVRRDMALSGLQSTYLPEFYAAAEARLVNDTLLVRLETDSAQPWRMLHTIDGRPAMERMERCRAVTCAATDGHRDRLAERELFAAPVYGTQFLLGSSDPAGVVRLDTLPVQLQEAPAGVHGRKPLVRCGNGILYVDATSPELDEKRFLEALTPDLRGLCFDLRGLPSVRFEAVLAHLIAVDAAAPATEVPVHRYPFRQGISWRIGTELLRVRAPHVALPALFLCDASTVSWGETILLMVRHYRLGGIVGQTTAGTTGDMTQFALPLFPFSMTGMRMRGMEGEPHHAQGVVPDRIVPLYACDCMERYDRTLHTALNLFDGE